MDVCVKRINKQKQDAFRVFGTSRAVTALPHTVFADGHQFLPGTSSSQKKVGKGERTRRQSQIAAMGGEVVSRPLVFRVSYTEHSKSARNYRRGFISRTYRLRVAKDSLFYQRAIVQIFPCLGLICAVASTHAILRSTRDRQNLHHSCPGASAIWVRIHWDCISLRI